MPAEFTNWRDEQAAWRETSALFDQSHHMTDLDVEGPDVLKLFSDLGVNTFANFAVDKAKQFNACNYEGFVIGDAILFCLEENRARLVGRPSAHNPQYHAETGDYDVRVERDERTAANPTGRRKLYRFQVQGPTAPDVLEAGRTVARSRRLLNMGELTLGGFMSGHSTTGCRAYPGSSSSGRGRSGRTCEAIVEAGDGFGSVRSAPAPTPRIRSNRAGSSPLPAIFTATSSKPYLGNGCRRTGTRAPACSSSRLR